MPAIKGVIGLALALVGGGWMSVVPARAETPAQICARLDTDDTLRPIPASLVPAVNALFETRMPSQYAVNSTVYRCAEGHVLICTSGANLPCGKANASRTNTGAAEWCRQNPDAVFVPAFATGHDTIYEWQCRGQVPIAASQTYAVDSRGYIAELWKRLNSIHE